MANPTKLGNLDSGMSKNTLWKLAPAARDALPQEGIAERCYP